MPPAVLQPTPRGDTILAVKIIVYTLTFGVILVIAGAIAALSLAVAPTVAKSNGWSVLAVILSGLAVAGGVVYLTEKLVNTAKGVIKMVLEVLTEKFKQHEREAGIKIGEERGREQGRAEGLAEGLEEGLEQGREQGLEQGRQEAREQAREQDRATRAWYERQQAAIRAGLPFEPPPSYNPEAHANGADGS